MQNFGPMHLIILISIVVIGLGLIFKGIGVPSTEPSVMVQPTAVTLASVLPVSVSDIGRRADDIPTPLFRTENKLIEIDLHTQEVVAEIQPGTTYKYWTYDGTVPGPFLRVMEGDDVLVRLHHGDGMVLGDDLQIQEFGTLEEAQAFIGTHVAHADEGHSHGMDDAHMGTDSHSAEGHATHSIDLHSVLGPGGGATLTQVGHDGPKAFQFKAMRAGIYVYHCASPHIPTHIANGMYGLMLVEPKGGLHPVDKEFYVMQGELYTTAPFGTKGHQEFDKARLLDENPTYFVFNGRVGSLTGERALKAKVGDRIRMYIGVGSFIPSNFHLIGGIFDDLYVDGAIISEPLKNVQTTLIPAGGAVMVEFTAEVPGTFLLVDHSLTRAIDKGAVAQLIIEGDARPNLFRGLE